MQAIITIRKAPIDAQTECYLQLYYLFFTVWANSSDHVI